MHIACRDRARRVKLFARSAAAHASTFFNQWGVVGAARAQCSPYAIKRKSLNVEECGHEIINEFHWSQKSRGAQAIIIATQVRTSNVAVTYERTVSTAGSDAIPRLVQLLCRSTITRSVRDEELARNEGVREKDLSESS